MRKALPIFTAFAAGLLVGIRWTTPVAEDREAAGDARSGTVLCRSTGGDSASGAEEPSAQCGEPSQVGDEAVVPPPTVEVIADGSPAPEMSAAHAVRQKRRRAAREAKDRERQDFLLSLNLDLLTDSQRKVHALYVEANETCVVLRKEISALRAAGKEVPADLQSRLADAESVLHADREAEQHALREAAARVAGLDEQVIRRLLDDIRSIDRIVGTER